MCRPAALSAWTAELESVFPHLSRPQVKVLAEYSHGMILAGKCGLSSVAAALGGWLGESSSTVRERLRDFYCDGVDKSGKHRRSLEIQSCFAPLLKWVLSDWQSDQLAIALDATTLGQRFVVLAISIVYRSGAIPVAWVVNRYYSNSLARFLTPDPYKASGGPAGSNCCDASSRPFRRTCA